MGPPPSAPSPNEVPAAPVEPRAAGTKRIVAEALGAAVLVTGAVTLASTFVPDRYVATAVGFIFLFATWVLVWRKDDATVVRAGLALGGLVMPGRAAPRDAARALLAALAWAAVLSAIVFVPFWFGWRWWWSPKLTFSLHVTPLDGLNEVFGQVVVIALPEEAFYRGYLQSRLDDAWGTKLRVAGAALGPGVLVASAVFALGHMATIHVPARLAVFFPALVFGWLRARTGGIGASLLFHALCNLFSEALGRGYGVY
jgi:membrane protease YdiL (CAAX protease family)